MQQDAVNFTDMEFFEHWIRVKIVSLLVSYWLDKTSPTGKRAHNLFATHTSRAFGRVMKTSLANRKRQRMLRMTMMMMTLALMTIGVMSLQEVVYYQFSSYLCHIDQGRCLPNAYCVGHRSIAGSDLGIHQAQTSLCCTGWGWRVL